MDALVLFTCLLAIYLSSSSVSPFLKPALGVQLGDPCSRSDGTDIGEPFVLYLDHGVTKQRSLLPHERRGKRAATAYRGLLWPNATVVFSISSEYTETEIEIIMDAMREWEDKTCIRFKSRTTEDSYIHFFKGFGCCSFVGNLNYGRQPISIPNACLHHAIVLHEIGHAIGFWHEHSRPDRDQYIRVMLQNVKPSYSRNFWKKRPSEVDSLGVTYDFNSIMHYHSSAFRRYSGASTLESIEPGIPLGNAYELSRLDVLQTKILYRCGKQSPPKLIPPKNVTNDSKSSILQTDLPPSNHSSCYHEFRGTSGSFSSPGYPKGYGIGVHCTWKISAPKGFFISIMLQPLLLTLDPCEDYVEVHDGPSLSSPVLRKLCGRFIRFFLQTTTNSAFIVFHSDNHTSLEDVGFKAFYAAIDIDECASDDICSHTCVNVPGSFVCMCKAGYYISSNGRFCHDINECGVENGHCSHACVNTAGSYVCRCPSNYRLGFDLHTCVPAYLPLSSNKCARHNGDCEQVCSLRGTYPDFTVACKCHLGYKLKENKRNCSDLNECDVVSHSCFPGECVNAQGSYYCACPNGYTNSSAQPSCNEIDECKANKDLCDHSCHNTRGSFYCTCRNGFHLSPDGTTCTDVDECIEGMHSCSQICVNLEGSYRCACKTGYQLNKGTCEDINECESQLSSQCDHSCVNSVGSFSCVCNFGYRMAEDGRHCIDINECDTDNGSCDDICVNTEGSYFCQCSTGLNLTQDHHSCIGSKHDSHCILGHHGCQPVCNHSTCRCAPGFRLSSSGKLCIDIDECTGNSSICGQHCTNTEGSYHCSCRSGYTLSSNQHACVPRSCAVHNGECEHECFVDVYNKTRCRCWPGFVILPNERLCSERLSNTSVSTCHLPCSHGCVMTGKVYACRCSPGYQLAGDGISCVDINECALGNGGCSQNCTNVEGAYHCRCLKGYVLGKDLRTCQDLNECTVSNPCHWRCVNTKGSYKCLCPNGFKLDDSNGICSPNCGGFYSSSSGSISSPWYPVFYPRQLDCWWFVAVPDSYAVDLFLSLDIDWTPDCSGDVVEVLNGRAWDAPTMGTLCGTRQASMTSSTSNVVVHFKSDNVRRGLHRGIRFTYKIGSPTGHFSCGSVNILKGSSYEFGNAGFPSFISSPLDCSWMMINLQHPFKKTAIDFIYYDVDSKGDCSKDYVIIGERIDEPIYKICTLGESRRLLVSVRVFRIWLHVETVNKFRGIHANARVI